MNVFNQLFAQGVTCLPNDLPDINKDQFNELYSTIQDLYSKYPSHERVKIAFEVIDKCKSYAIHANDSVRMDTG